MKKTTVKKLELKRNTVKQLTKDQLGNAAGGIWGNGGVLDQPDRPRECTCAASGC